jgi:Flp pilus assembly protein TadG
MMWRFIQRLRASERGGVMIEAGLAIPILIVMLLAGFEISRLTLLNQKLDRAATSMADLVSQSKDLTSAQLTDMFSAIQHVMEPFDVGASGKVVVSSIGTVGANPTTIFWQRTGSGTITATSQIGIEGGTPTLPAGMTIATGEGLIVAEIFYDYTPFIFWDFVSANQIYRTAFFRPRFGGLDVLN